MGRVEFKESEYNRVQNERDKARLSLESTVMGKQGGVDEII